MEELLKQLKQQAEQAQENIQQLEQMQTDIQNNQAAIAQELERQSQQIHKQ